MKQESSQKKGVPFDIPLSGSLGLLALGDRGIRAWRKVKEEEKANKKASEK
ncbi:MAG: hypothetical protein QNK23_07800 [Crocinitomicaceae bacterium]|nr:hypothetical protein [Crocinitomicaceae bacterium]